MPILSNASKYRTCNLGAAIKAMSDWWAANWWKRIQLEWWLSWNASPTDLLANSKGRNPNLMDVSVMSTCINLYPPNGDYLNIYRWSWHQACYKLQYNKHWRGTVYCNQEKCQRSAHNWSCYDNQRIQQSNK